jgi:hypothetical protein
LNMKRLQKQVKFRNNLEDNAPIPNEKIIDKSSFTVWGFPCFPLFSGFKKV